LKTREIRGTGVKLSELGFGGAGLGELFTKVSDREAEATLNALWNGGVRFFDTAPLYGRGLSELRLGQSLRPRKRAHLVLSTKVGYVLREPEDTAAWAGDGFSVGGLPFDRDVDFSYDGVMRSYEDSLQRLGFNRVDILVIHDLDSSEHHEASIAAQWKRLESSGWRALTELRASGRIRALGVGIKTIAEIPRFLEAFDLDLVLVVGRYTLLDQTALPETFAACERHQVDVVLAGAFNSGILATGPVAGARLHYRAAAKGDIQRVAKLADLCGRHGVPLQAAAIQFPLAHSLVRSVLVGPVTASEARANVEAYKHPIPAGFWHELRAEQWIPPEAPIPGETGKAAAS
jgi:D-threo-aldose 1-dehydrogenase